MKIFSLFLAIVLVFLFSSCGEDKKENGSGYGKEKPPFDRPKADTTQVEEEIEQ